MESAAVALAMVEAGLADPLEWNGSASRFVARALSLWAEEIAGPIVDRTYGFVLRLSRDPGFDGSVEDEYWDDPEAGSGRAPLSRLYLELWPEWGEHYGIELQRPIEALEKVDRRFPSMFWPRFRGALSRAGLELWDPAWALEEETYGWASDWYADHEANVADEDDGEEPLPRPSAEVPKSLRRAAVKDRTVIEAVRNVPVTSDGHWAAQLLSGAIEISDLSKDLSNGFDALTAEEKDRYSGFAQLPSLIAFLRPGDAITHLVDMYGDSITNAGEPTMPACCWAFDPTPEGVLSAHTQFKRCGAVLRKGAELLYLLDNPGESLPLAITLNV